MAVSSLAEDGGKQAQTVQGGGKPLESPGLKVSDKVSGI